MINKIFNIVNEYRNKKKIQSIIQEFDKSVNINGNFPGYRYLKKVFEPENIKLDSPMNYDRFGMSTSKIINKDVALILNKSIKLLEKDIRDYLGGETRLDDLSIWWFNPAKAIKPGVSGGWHQDNCGNRLKLYICLEGDGSTPTIIQKDSHKKMYSFGIKDLLRFIGKADTKDREDEIRLEYRSGDIAVFDTHLMHRGLYETPATKRVVILAEFINRNKCNAIHDHAPCGPEKVIFDKDAFDIINNTKFIDHSLINKKYDLYEYSLK